MVIINRQVAVTLPQKLAVFRAHGLWLNQAKIDIHLDALLDDLFVDLVASPVPLDLVNNGLCD